MAQNDNQEVVNLTSAKFGSHEKVMKSHFISFENPGIPGQNTYNEWYVTCERSCFRCRPVAWRAPCSRRRGKLKPGRRTPRRSVSTPYRQHQPPVTRSPPDRRLVQPGRAESAVDRSTASCSGDVANAASPVP